MKAIIPAAGYATRLYPLTENQPKALLEIAWKSMLEHCLSKIEELWHLDEVYVVTNKKFTPHFEKRKSVYQGNLSVTIINDGTSSNEDRLWALGDIQFVIDQAHIDDDILVIAGDNLFEDSLLWLYKIFTTRQKSSISVYNLWDKSIARSFGVVEVDEQWKVVTFEEKPLHPKSSLVSTMIYFIKKEDLSVIQTCITQGKQDNGGNLIHELIKNNQVYTYTLSWYWYDIGNKDQLNTVKERLG